MAPTVKPEEKAPPKGAPEPDQSKEQTVKSEDDDNKSVISSSSFHDEFDIDKYVDLTHAETCRVKHKRKQDGAWINVVCGAPIGVCSYRGHQETRVQTGGRGEPGFYIPVVNRKGWKDGNLDARYLTSTELNNLQGNYAVNYVQNDDEDNANDDDDDDGSLPSVTNAHGQTEKPVFSASHEGQRLRSIYFGKTTIHGDDDSFRSAYSAVNHSQLGQTPLVANHARNNKKTLIGPAPSPPPPPDPFYGLEGPTGQRVATSDAVIFEKWKAKGFVHVITLPDEEAAAAWVLAGTANPQPQANSHPPSTMGQCVPTSPRKLTSDPGFQIANNLANTVQWKDKSEGKSMMFGIDLGNLTAVNNFLLPPGLLDPEAQLEFYETVMDSLSLPGSYRSTSDDDGHTSTIEAIQAAMGGKKRKFFRAWKHKTHNALAKITSEKTLQQHVSDVEKVSPRHLDVQEKRMKSILYKMGHPEAVVDAYLHYGQLPIVAALLHKHLMDLYNEARTMIYDMPATSFTDSLCGKMIAHHSRELGYIRTTANDYRTFLLEAYVYLRNARRDNFQNSSFLRKFLQSLSEEKDTGSAKKAPAVTDNRCNHCRRAGLGCTNKDTCKLGDVPSPKAQAALSRMTKAQAKKVTQLIVEAKTQDPTRAWDEIVQEARSAVGV